MKIQVTKETGGMQLQTPIFSSDHTYITYIPICSIEINQISRLVARSNTTKFPD